MKEIKILGTGCAKCQATYQLVKDVAQEYGFTGNIEKVEDIVAIMSYAVLSTPAVVIDNRIAFTGGIPDKDLVKSWFQSPSQNCCK